MVESKDSRDRVLLGMMTAMIVVAIVMSLLSTCSGGEKAAKSYDDIQNQRMEQIEERVADLMKKSVEHEIWISALQKSRDNMHSTPHPIPVFPERTRKAKPAPTPKYYDKDVAVTRTSRPQPTGPALRPSPDPLSTPSTPQRTRLVRVGTQHTWSWTHGWHRGIFGPRLGWGWTVRSSPLMRRVGAPDNVYFPRSKAAGAEIQLP